MSPLISVIIPHYNDLENLRQCLDLLDAQSVPRERIEVLVADNNSPVGLPAVKEATDGRAEVIVEARKGAGLARNAGAAAASADILAFVDSDCRPAPDWIENGLKALETCDVVGGRVRVGRGATGSLTPAEAFECVFAFDIESYVRRKGFVPSGNMFVRRETFEKVGGFRGGVSEDVEWGRRAGSKGMKLDYGHDVMVEHPARATWAELTSKWRRMSLEAYLLMREQPMGRLKWLARSWAVLLSPFVHVFKVLSSPELEAPSDRAKAVGALFAIRGFRFLEAHRVVFRNGR